MMKRLLATLLSVIAISPALADSGRMVKSIGSSAPAGRHCTWFQTTNASNGIDPVKYGFSERDPGVGQATITINNALGSILAPKFVISDRIAVVEDGFYPEDCPASAGFVHVHTIVRGP